MLSEAGYLQAGFNTGNGLVVQQWQSPANRPELKPVYVAYNEKTGKLQDMSALQKDGGFNPESIDDIAAWVENHRSAGRTIVAVQGLGFVGQAMASVIAHSSQLDIIKNKREYAVIGVDVPANKPRLDLINQGKSPIEADDKDVKNFLEQSVARGVLIATTNKDVYQFANIIVVDVPFEADKPGIQRAIDMVTVS